jgi:hypothetical protein
MPRCYGPGHAPTWPDATRCAIGAAPGADAGSVSSPRRARLLVSVAAVAAVLTVVLLALLVAGLLRGTGAGPALFHGLVAAGTAGLALGLLVLARAGAVAATGRPVRARGLCARVLVAALTLAVLVVLGGVLAASVTGSALPAWGGAVADVLLALLAAVAIRRRAALRAAPPPAARRRRPGGGGESEPDRATGAR